MHHSASFSEYLSKVVNDDQQDDPEICEYTDWLFILTDASVYPVQEISVSVEPCIAYSDELPADCILMTPIRCNSRNDLRNNMKFLNKYSYMQQTADQTSIIDYLQIIYRDFVEFYLTWDDQPIARFSPSSDAE